MAPKVFINDSVYKVFRIGISDVGKCLFCNGFLGILGALLADCAFVFSEENSSQNRPEGPPRPTTVLTTVLAAKQKQKARLLFVIHVLWLQNKSELD